MPRCRAPRSFSMVRSDPDRRPGEHHPRSVASGCLFPIPAVSPCVRVLGLLPGLPVPGSISCCSPGPTRSRAAFQSVCRLRRIGEAVTCEHRRASSTSCKSAPCPPPELKQDAVFAASVWRAFFTTSTLLRSIGSPRNFTPATSRSIRCDRLPIQVGGQDLPIVKLRRRRCGSLRSKNRRRSTADRHCPRRSCR